MFSLMHTVTANKKFLCFVYIIFSLKVSVVLANTEVGLRNYKEGEFKKAYEEFFSESKKGNANAQYYLGCMFLKGEGVKKSFMWGFKWLSIAADKGHVKALNVVGVIYKNGVETSKNTEEAKKYLQLSAEKNFNLGQFNLGVLLIENYKEKIENLSHENVKQENDDHSNSHSKEENHRTDLIEGYKWLKISELNGFDRASTILKLLSAEILHSELIVLDEQANEAFKSLKNQNATN